MWDSKAVPTCTIIIPLIHVLIIFLLIRVISHDFLVLCRSAGKLMRDRSLGAKALSLWVSETPAVNIYLILIGVLFLGRTIRLENIRGHDFSLFRLGRRYDSVLVIIGFSFIRGLNRILGEWLEAYLMFESILRLISSSRCWPKLRTTSHGLTLEMLIVSLHNDRVLALEMPLLGWNALVDADRQILQALGTR